MTNARWHILVTLTLCVVTAFLTHHVTRTFLSGDQPARTTSAGTAQDAAHPSVEKEPGVVVSRADWTELQADLEQFRQDLVRTQEDLAQLEQATLQGTLSILLARVADNSHAVHDAREVIARGVQRMSLKDDQWFGGLYDFIFTLSDVAKMGDAGVEALVRVVEDTSADPERRQHALELLMFLPHKRSLDLLMKPHPELDYDHLDDAGDAGIYLLVERLPTSDVAPHIPELNRYVADSLRDGRVDKKAIDLLLVLALTHGNPESRRMLRELRTQDGQIEAALASANWLRTEEARRFIEDVSRTHPNLAIRDKARELLSGF